jgi:hypothetical protein
MFGLAKKRPVRVKPSKCHDSVTGPEVNYIFPIREIEMWYPTVTEIRQITPPGEKRAEQQSEPFVDPTVPADAEKAVVVPGSEYWLP